MREDQTTRKPTWAWAWAAWLIALCAAIVVYSFLYPNGNTSNIGYTVGRNLPIGLVIWGVFQLTVGRKLGRRKTGVQFGKDAVAFLSIWCALVAGSLGGYAQQRGKAIQAISEIQKSYSALIVKSGASTSVPPRGGSVVEGESTSSGQFGEMTMYMKEQMANSAALQENYKTALREIGWSTILDPSRLGRDANLVNSKSMLRKAVGIVHQYHAKNDELLASARAGINNLNFSDKVKEVMRRNFDKTSAMARQRIDAIWAIQSKIVSQFKNIISLLGDRREAWKAEGNHIIFSKQTDLDTFNGYLHGIHELVAQDHKIRNQNAKLVGNNLKRLKEEISR